MSAFDVIPAAACMLSGGEVVIGENGEKSKTAPVRIKARSGQFIEHPFWGRIVHDFAGMRPTKAKLPIDYAHRSDEVLGYLNRFDASSGDLFVSGALIPFESGDRASEVLFKMKEGVPYEASIFFGGDGIKLQELAEGESQIVNGVRFDGPGVIVREWPLRGVAICPYGADGNTESMALSDSRKNFSAAKWQPVTEEGNQNMSTTPEPAPSQTQEAAQELTPVEAKVTEASAEAGQPAVEAPAVEAPKVEESKPAQETPDQLARKEFGRMVKDFGATIASEVFAAGGTHADAQAKYVAELKRENEELKAKLPTAPAGSAQPAAFAASGDNKGKTLRELCEKGTRK